MSRRSQEVPWLVELATQSQSSPGAELASYDPRQQMSIVAGDPAKLAIASASPIASKKADRETGEDQKEFR